MPSKFVKNKKGVEGKGSRCILTNFSRFSSLKAGDIAESPQLF